MQLASQPQQRRIVAARVDRGVQIANQAGQRETDLGVLASLFSVENGRYPRGELLDGLRRAVETELSARQRRIFEAIVLNQVPLDVLTIEMDTNRGAIYKTMFDARRKLRAVLAARGYLAAERGDERTVGQS